MFDNVVPLDQLLFAIRREGAREKGITVVARTLRVVTAFLTYSTPRPTSSRPKVWLMHFPINQKVP